MDINIVTDKSDIEKAIELYVSAGWGDKKDYSSHIERKYKRSFDNSNIFSAYIGDELVGLLRFFTDFNSTTYIIELLVRPEYQKQGIGGLLLQKLIDEHGDTTIYTDGTEKYLQFYLSRGFKAHKLIGVSRKSNDSKLII